MTAYQRGQTVQLSNTFYDEDGDASDPATVVCLVEAPDGTETTYDSDSTPAVSSPAGSGLFSVVIVADQSGMWTYRWEGTTGTSVAVDERQFTVLLSAFEPVVAP
jgi:hypothetical protein